MFIVVFTKKIPRPLFDAIAMTYRYEWPVMSYALFMHEDYPTPRSHFARSSQSRDRHAALRRLGIKRSHWRAS